MDSVPASIQGVFGGNKSLESRISGFGGVGGARPAWVQLLQLGAKGRGNQQEAARAPGFRPWGWVSFAFFVFFPKLLSRPIRCSVNLYSFIHSGPSPLLGAGCRAGNPTDLVPALKELTIQWIRRSSGIPRSPPPLGRPGAGNVPVGALAHC